MSGYFVFLMGLGGAVLGFLTTLGISTLDATSWSVLNSGLLGAVVSAVVTYFVANRQMVLARQQFETQATFYEREKVRVAEKLMDALKKKVEALDSGEFRQRGLMLERVLVLKSACEDARPVIYGSADVPLIERFETVTDRVVHMGIAVQADERGTYQRAQQSTLAAFNRS